MAHTLTLKVVSQERQLVETTVSQITAPTTQGEVTILPDHIPLFAKLDAGELLYLENGVEQSIVISPGFLNVAPGNLITVMTDSAVLAREISLEKAQEAMRLAKESIATAKDRRELILAEASLKRAMLEVQIAQRTRRSQV